MRGVFWLSVEQMRRFQADTGAESSIAVVKRVGTAPSHNCQKKKSVKREFLSLRVVTRKTDDTIMMYKNLAIDLCIFE